jgi:hypothetical protein
VRSWDGTRYDPLSDPAIERLKRITPTVVRRLLLREAARLDPLTAAFASIPPTWRAVGRSGAVRPVIGWLHADIAQRWSAHAGYPQIVHRSANTHLALGPSTIPGKTARFYGKNPLSP